MRKIYILILLLCSFTLVGCDFIEGIREKKEEAISLVENFCEALTEEDYNGMKEYLHPDSNLNGKELKKYISTLEEENKIDFSKDVKLIRRSNFESIYYNSLYDGSEANIKYDASVGGVFVIFKFTIVRNDNGYGIYNFYII